MRALGFFIGMVLWCMPAAALEVMGLQVEVREGAEHVTLQLSGPLTAKVFAIQGASPRIAVDIPSAHWRGKVALPKDYNGQLVRDLRFSYHDAKTSRLVLDLAASAKPRNVRVTHPKEEKGYRLEFDLVEPHSSAEPVPSHEEDTSRHRAHSAEKPVIVIDAGHGGQDPGTSGYAGAHEKNITLRYARALAETLEKTGHYRVALTRDDDRYLLLRERVRRAREAKGDLFISLHADSAPARYARGLSVYTISETASDKTAEALAAKENKADIIGGMDLSGTSEDVANILIDLTQRETRAQSARFADLAIRNLSREVQLLSHTHRFAGFAVLKAPDIPSVLIEVGFLTNPSEERQLQSSAYEARIVHALVKSVEAYFGKKR
jgi:N-acetylmuramoyl-L-alanine amidase